jgi:2-polyprenyl-6-methoxyphenol hydroxylase-like FAD-dependent oxidoreductase
MPTARAEELAKVSDAEFDAALAEAAGNATASPAEGDGSRARANPASRLRVRGPRATWPLMQAAAAEVVGPGWALVGDAAHVIHPLAGQGLNLGLADAATLVRIIGERESWRTLGDEALLRRYARARLWPNRAMAGAVDGLWQLFSASAPGLRELRNQGMSLVNHLGPLKRFLVARALGS